MSNKPAITLLVKHRGFLGIESIPLREYKTDPAEPGKVAVKEPRKRQWTVYAPRAEEGIEYATIEVAGDVVWDSRNGSAPTAQDAPEIMTAQTGEASFQVMPDLTPEQFEGLRASIEHHGVLVPITVDEYGVIIDGHHRAWIAQELGIECPREVRALVTDADKRSWAYEVNAIRRQLNREQRRDLVAQSLMSDPQLSDREHARRVGMSPTTVGTIRAELEGRGDVSKLDTRTDSTGREQPSSKPAREPEPVEDIANTGVSNLDTASDEPQPKPDRQVPPSPWVVGLTTVHAGERDGQPVYNVMMDGKLVRASHRR